LRQQSLRRGCGLYLHFARLNVLNLEISEPQRTRHDRCGDIENAKRQIQHSRYAERGGHVRAARVPRYQGRCHCSSIGTRSVSAHVFSNEVRYGRAGNTGAMYCSAAMISNPIAVATTAAIQRPVVFGRSRIGSTSLVGRSNSSSTVPKTTAPTMMIPSTPATPPAGSTAA